MSATNPSNAAMMQAIVTTTVPVSMRYPFSHLVSGRYGDRQPLTLNYEAYLNARHEMKKLMQVKIPYSRQAPTTKDWASYPLHRNMIRNTTVMPGKMSLCM